jgi:hypothetical protein
MSQGLYLLGAGASAGAVPLGEAFWTASPLDYLRHARSFPVAAPDHSELTRRMIKASRDLSLSEIIPDREVRPGADVLPYQELLQRLPDYYARLQLKHALSKARFSGRLSDSYRVFQLFRRSLIANYNHDGLATDFCGGYHRVLEMHGTIASGYGSPDIERHIRSVRELEMPEIFDGILMGVPESLDSALAERLFEIARYSPDFVSIIGYSFAQRGKDYDDRVSLEIFLNAWRHFKGNIYVIGPDPCPLANMLGERLKSKKVFGLRAYWNVLAHAFIVAMREPRSRRSLSYNYQQILDVHGSNAIFPRQ